MDYNDFYQQSLAAGAQPDDNGGIRHTPASIATMQMQEENKLWGISSSMFPAYQEEQRRQNSFWRNLLNGF